MSSSTHSPEQRLPERDLRHIWSRQEFGSLPLHTTDGRLVEVLSPGALNLMSGPDYREARIRIGGVLYVGDVEFHRTAADWLVHHHADDPHYEDVILHVVLDDVSEDLQTRSASGRTIPTLILGPHLYHHRSEAEHQSQLDERLRIARSIPCAEANYDVPASVIERTLLRMGAERMRLKAARMEERLAELAEEQVRERDVTPASAYSNAGCWNQVLYEGMLDALGYTRNRVPFMRLARAASLDTIERLGVVDTPILLEAFIFGVAGVLSTPEGRAEALQPAQFVLLREAWRVLRQRYRGEILAYHEWTTAPTRPANAPAARLPQAITVIRMILREGLLAQCVDAIRRTPEPRDLSRALELLIGRTGAGERRVHEIIVNVMVPFGLLYGRVFRERDVVDRMRELIDSMSPESENSVTRLMEEHLMRGKVAQGNALTAQGAIHLFRMKCARGGCQGCPVGEWLGMR